MWGGVIVKVTSVRKCKFKYPEEQRSLTGRRLALMRKINPDFHPYDEVCLIMKPHEMRRFVTKLDRELEKRGIECNVQTDTTRIDLLRCRLTYDFVDDYGYNLSPRLTPSGERQRRGRVLNWYDWVDFNETINDVMDNMRVSANVTSSDLYGGRFIIRRGRDRADPSDWDELKEENIGRDYYPLFRPDLWKSEGRGRVGFWQDEANRKIVALKRQKVTLPPNLEPEQLQPMLKEAIW